MGVIGVYGWDHSFGLVDKIRSFACPWDQHSYLIHANGGTIGDSNSIDIVL